MVTSIKSITNYKKWWSLKWKKFRYKKVTACRFLIHHFSKKFAYKLLLVEICIYVFHLLSVTSDLQIHGNINFHEFFILFGLGGQVVQEPFFKENVAISSFRLVIYNNCTIKNYIWSRYVSVARNLTKVVLCEVYLSSSW